MDRGAWRATVHGVTRVGLDLAAKPAKNTGHGGSSVSVGQWEVVSHPVQIIGFWEF